METNKTFQFIHDFQHQLAKYWLELDGMLRRLPWRRIGIVALASVGGLTLAYSLAFFWPRSVQLSYAGSNCIVNPVILPGLVNAQSSEAYNVALDPTWTIGGIPIYSHTTCVTPRQAPQPNASQSVQLAPLLIGGVLAKTITIDAQPTPTLQAATPLDSPVPVALPLSFKLDQADELFRYQLSGNSHTVLCTTSGDTVDCDLQQLAVAQGTHYDISLQRLFNNDVVETVLETAITTVDAITITGSSIAHGQTVYDIPTDLVVTLNKPAVSYDGIELTTGGQPVAVTHSLTDSTLTIHFTEPLARSVEFDLTINKIVAKDGGYLVEPFKAHFATSGGPKVAGINIGSSKVSTGASISLTFDSNLAGGQNLLHYIRLERDAGQMDATYSLRGKTVTVTPRGGMPKCTAFTVKVLDGLKSEAGISGGSGTWQYNSRTLCQTSFSIGSSVKGRGITGYKFGSGAEKVMFVGGIHGNEKSAAYILNSWLDYLEANPGAIPAHRTVIVIPNVNPDGYAISNRLNANTVDLNRNFPSNNWQAAVTEPNGTYLAYGGGSEPLSEPESQALADYVLSQDPVLVMSYHASGRILSANESGNSLALAQTYGAKSGYPAYGNDTGGTFDYSITGAFEDWLRDKPGIGCILVELTTKTGNEFTSHRAAMLAMIQF